MADKPKLPYPHARACLCPECCAIYVANRLPEDRERSAQNFQNNLSWDAKKLLARVDELLASS